MQRLNRNIFKSKHILTGLTLSLILISIYTLNPQSFFTNTLTAIPHEAELRFAEASNNKNLEGKVLPASCDSDPKIWNGYGTRTGCSCNPSTESWKPFQVHRCSYQSGGFDNPVTQYTAWNTTTTQSTCDTYPQGQLQTANLEKCVLNPVSPAAVDINFQ